MKRIVFCLFFVVLAFLKTVKAQNWERVPGPDGGVLTNIVQVNQTGTVYGFFQDFNKHLYRSTDGGLHWQSQVVTRNGVDITNNLFIGRTGVFYSILDTFVNSSYRKYLYSSVDEGQHWSLTNTSMPQAINRLNETATGILFGYLYSSLDTRIYRSVDQGQTWILNITLPGGLGFFDTFMSGNGQIMLQELNTDATYFSNNDGQTWQASNAAVKYGKVWFTPAGTLLAHVELGASQNRLLRSVNLGQTWDTLPEQTLPIPWYVKLTSMASVPSGRIFAKSEQMTSVVVSDDDGVSWQLDSVPFSFDNFLLPKPLANGHLLANWGDEMFLMPAALDTAIFASNNLGNAEIYRFEAMNDSVFFAATSRDLYRKIGGQPWELILESCNDFRLGYNQSLVAIGMEYDKAFVSTDMGQTFRPILVLNDPGLEEHFPTPPFFSPGDSLMFTSTIYGLYRSGDLGLTWQLVNPFFYSDLYNMVFLPSGRILAFDIVEGLFYSDNGGLNWELLPVSLDGAFSYERQIAADAAGRLYMLNTGIGVSGDPRLFVSDDEGESWTVVNNIDNLIDRLFGISLNSLGHVFLKVNDQLQFSPNGALNWQLMPSIEDGPGDAYVKNIGFDPSGRAYATTIWNYGVYRTVNSTTSGAYLQGTVRRDGDADCTTSDEQPARLDHWVVEAEGASTFLTTTDSLGRYTMFVDTGNYVVNVQTPQYLWWSVCQTDQIAVLPQLLAVDTVDFSTQALADCPLISVSMSTAFLRRCFPSEISVLFCNQGTEAADSAWIDVELDPYLAFLESAQPHIDLGGNTLRFFIGDVSSGACGQFKFKVEVDCDSTVIGQTHCISAHGFPDTLCTPVPNWSGAEIQASVECQQDTLVAFKLQNVGGVNSAVLDYIIIEDDVVMLQDAQQYAPGQSITIPVPANGHTYRIESEQEPGHPFSILALAFQEGCGGFESLGFINQFTVNGFTPSQYTLCEENIGAYDPNDKQGFPLGIGEDHRIPPGQFIDYRIRFQNTGTDTAFTVVIRDTLSAWLDPASIVMGASSHLYTWQLEGSNVIKFTFNQINLPDSNVSWEGSQGYVRFRLAQRPNLPLGTQILNKAAIYFDFNPAVITNETMHTIGYPDVVETTEPNSGREHLVQVTPNPAILAATFTFQKGWQPDCRLQLYNPLGAVLEQFQIENEHWTIPRRQLPAGAYPWVLIAADGTTLDSGILIFQ